MWVTTDKRPYTVKARNERFAVCTKPFNLRHTVLYFVLDTEERCRGPENLIFGMGAETVEQCEEMLARLASGDTEVTSRNFVDWDVWKVVP